jgi:hypothetical protein
MDDSSYYAGEPTELSCVPYAEEQRDSGRQWLPRGVVARDHSVDCRRPALWSDKYCIIVRSRGIPDLVKPLPVEAGIGDSTRLGPPGVDCGCVRAEQGDGTFWAPYSGFEG